MVKKFFESRLHRLTYGSLVVMAIFFLALARKGDLAAGFGAHESLLYYASISTKSFGYVVLGGTYFAAAFLVVIVTMSLVRNFMNLARGRKEMPTMLGSDSAKGALANGARKVAATLRILAPVFLFTIILSFTLDGLNAINKTHLMDLTLINGEKAALGNYGFMVFSAAPYPDVLIRFIILSFEGMSGILLAAAIVIASVRLNLLREFVAAFCVCMLLMVPLWLALPALSPQDRFIDNAYHLPVPREIASAVVDFHPMPPIADFLATVRTGKSGLADLPTSTIPSAHAAWAVLVGFYLFRTRKWLGWIALPFLIGSTLGTVILAQHYLVDPIIGIMIAWFAIWAVEKIVSRDIIKV
jgi:PAP2 superfamily